MRVYLEGVGLWWRKNIRLGRRSFIKMGAPVHILERMFKVKATLNTLLEWFLEAWR